MTTHFKSIDSSTNMNGFAIITKPEKLELFEELFDSGEEQEFEDLLEAYPEVLPYYDIHPSIKSVVPIGR